MNGTSYFSDSTKRSTLINSDQLIQYATDKWNLDPSCCDYNIVATLGMPMSGKSKHISMTLLSKIANSDQPHFSMIYLAPTLLVVMPLAI
jgi:hypothetical protein